MRSVLQSKLGPSWEAGWLPSLYTLGRKYKCRAVKIVSKAVASRSPDHIQTRGTAGGKRTIRGGRAGTSIPSPGKRVKEALKGRSREGGYLAGLGTLLRLIKI